MHTLDNVPHTCIIELAAAAAAAAPGFTHETPGNTPGKAGRTYARAKDGHGGSKRCGANKATERPPAGAAPLESGLGTWECIPEATAASLHVTWRA